jgi:hypothetical protein
MVAGAPKSSTGTQKKKRTELQSFLDRHGKNKSYTQALRRKKLQPPAATAVCLYFCLLLVCDRSLKKRTLMPEAPAINNTHVLLPVLVFKLSHLH